jgi:hypothetical protein
LKVGFVVPWLWVFGTKWGDKAFDAPKKYNYRTKNDQKIFLRFNAPK